MDGRVYIQSWRIEKVPFIEQFIDRAEVVAAQVVVYYFVTIV